MVPAEVPLLVLAAGGVTRALAVLGAITGLTGTALAILNFFRDRPRLALGCDVVVRQRFAGCRINATNFGRQPISLTGTFLAEHEVGARTQRASGIVLPVHDDASGTITLRPGEAMVVERGLADLIDRDLQPFVYGLDRRVELYPYTVDFRGRPAWGPEPVVIDTHPSTTSADLCSAIAYRDAVEEARLRDFIEFFHIREISRIYADPFSFLQCKPGEAQDHVSIEIVLADTELVQQLALAVEWSFLESNLGAIALDIVKSCLTTFLPSDADGDVIGNALQALMMHDEERLGAALASGRMGLQLGISGIVAVLSREAPSASLRLPPIELAVDDVAEDGGRSRLCVAVRFLGDATSTIARSSA